MRNRQICLSRRPLGIPAASDFTIVENPVPAIADGECLIRNHWLGLAPSARLRMNEERAYAPPIPLGGVVFGQTVGQVLQSRHRDFAEGDFVLMVNGGWQDYCITQGDAVFKIDVNLAPAQAYLGPFGTSGMAAYIGAFHLAQPKAGETFVVSAASGAVGSVAGQIARIAGCRVIGIAGGDAKCQYAVGTLGFDACVDHRSSTFVESLEESCRTGIDIDFENVGGRIASDVIRLLNPHARLIVCGLISEYNNDPAHGALDLFTVLTKRLQVHGFLVSDNLAVRPAFLDDMTKWFRSGRIVCREDVTVGLDNAPGAFIGMLQGANFGKALVRIVA